MLNAVVAELSIHKLKNERGRINSLRKVLSDEHLGAKLRVTENRCVLFNSLTYVYRYIYIYFSNSDGMESRYKMVKLFVDNLIQG